MMLEEQVVSILLADADVSAIVGSNVFPKKIPQGTALPAITYIRVSDPRIFSLLGMSGKTNPRIQIDCWADTYAGAKDLGEKVLAAMNAATAFKIGAVDIQDLDEDDDSGHRHSADYSVWY